MEQKKSKFWDKPFGTVVLYLILYVISFILANVFCMIFLVVELEPKWLDLLTSYFTIGLMGLIFFLYMRFKDKESFKTVLPDFGNNNLKNVGLGLVAGLCANMGLGLMAWGNGCITISFKGMNIGFAIIAFVIVAFQCVGEEIIERVFLFQRLSRAKGPIVAIIISSAIFAIMHIPNLIMFDVEPVFGVIAMVNIILIGVYFCETIYFGNNVWYAFAFHTAWNYSQNYILGLPNSGYPATESAFVLADSGSNNVLFYSTAFGIEASWGATIVFIILIVVNYIIGKRRNL